MTRSPGRRPAGTGPPPPPARCRAAGRSAAASDAQGRAGRQHDGLAHLAAESVPLAPRRIEPGGRADGITEPVGRHGRPRAVLVGEDGHPQAHQVRWERTCGQHFHSHDGAPPVSGSAGAAAAPGSIDPGARRPPRRRVRARRWCSPSTQRAMAHSRSDRRFRYRPTWESATGADQQSRSARRTTVRATSRAADGPVGPGYHELGRHLESSLEIVDVALEGGDHLGRDQGRPGCNRARGTDRWPLRPSVRTGPARGRSAVGPAPNRPPPRPGPGP